MDDARWLDPAEMDAWVRLVAVLQLLPASLDAQLRRDSDLTHFEYGLLVALSAAPGGTLRMGELARRTTATLPRLSHVVRRLEERGLVARDACSGDGRSREARLTDQGLAVLRAAAPGHVARVRGTVLDALTREQLGQLAAIADALLGRLDPDGRLTALYRPAAGHPGGDGGGRGVGYGDGAGGGPGPEPRTAPGPDGVPAPGISPPEPSPR